LSPLWNLICTVVFFLLSSTGNFTLTLGLSVETTGLPFDPRDTACPEKAVYGGGGGGV
jgi:hypothetical protein